MHVTEWTFTPVSVGRLAMTLHLPLRDHRLALPDDPGLVGELATVRLRETRPGVSGSTTTRASTTTAP